MRAKEQLQICKIESLSWLLKELMLAEPSIFLHKAAACRLRLSILPMMMTTLAAVLLVPAAISDQLSPSDVYLQYHKAMRAADSISALTSYLSRKSVDEIKKTPAEQVPVFFGLMKDLTPKSVKVVSEKIDGETALLTMAVDDATTPADNKTIEKTSGTVKLVKENGVWKVDQESWSSQITSNVSSPPGIGDSPATAPSVEVHATESSAGVPAGQGADEAAGEPVGSKAKDR